MDDICFPVPQHFSLTATVPAIINTNETIKKSLFQQTIKTAYRVDVPSRFTSSYNKERPYQLVSEEQIEKALSQSKPPFASILKVGIGG